MRAISEASSAFIGAFREDAVTTLLNSDEFDEFDSRRLRYDIYKASYENTSFRNIHAWAQGRRVRYGLGKYIRDIENPTARVVDFHSGAIWRGSLTPLLVGGAVPLVVSGSNEQRVREAADNLLRMSNFEVGKNITALKGSNLGDVALKLCDDPQRGQVRIEVVDPSIIEDVVLSNGICKGYVLTEWRENENGLMTKYSEVCERGDNDDVIYRTYINDTPAVWPGAEQAEWVEPYGFIPFVTIQHRNMGGTWGWAELHTEQSKIMELDNLASFLSDYISKSINAPALISGIAKPTKALKTETADADVDNPYPGREEMKLLWAGDGKTATYTPMIADLDIPSASARIDKILASIEADMPEMRRSIWDLAGDPSGKAIEVAREPVENKIENRRVNYDAALVRALQMGIAIGGFRRYPGFEGFDLGSYERGQLDISIAQRPVFGEQKSEKLTQKKDFWAGWASVSSSGTPFAVYARDFGWTDQQIAEYNAEVQKSYIPAEGL